MKRRLESPKLCHYQYLLPWYIIFIFILAISAIPSLISPFKTQGERLLPQKILSWTAVFLFPTSIGHFPCLIIILSVLLDRKILEVKGQHLVYCFLNRRNSTNLFWMKLAKGINFIQNTISTKKMNAYYAVQNKSSRKHISFFRTVN